MCDCQREACGREEVVAAMVIWKDYNVITLEWSNQSCIVWDNLSHTSNDKTNKYFLSYIEASGKTNCLDYLYCSPPQSHHLSWVSLHFTVKALAALVLVLHQ